MWSRWEWTYTGSGQRCYQSHRKRRGIKAKGKPNIEEEEEWNWRGEGGRVGGEREKEIGESEEGAERGETEGWCVQTSLFLDTKITRPFAVGCKIHVS